MNLMGSILIKDTSRKQRKQIVLELLDDDYDVSSGYEVTPPEERKNDCNMI